MKDLIEKLKTTYLNLKEKFLGLSLPERILIVLGSIAGLIILIMIILPLIPHGSTTSNNNQETLSITPSLSPEPTVKISDEGDDSASSHKFIPTVIKIPTPTATLTPTPTLTPTVTPTPTNTPTPTPTITPTPADTVPPNITNLSGPENNSISTVNNFCFSATIYDAVSSNSSIQTQSNFDGVATDWASKTEYCFTGVADGNHTFSIKAKDAASNQSITISRNFSVKVN